MNTSKIPVRYAKALVELSEEKNLTDKIYNDILIIQNIVKLPEVKEILCSPVISSNQKNQILISVLPDKINDITTSFINMVFKNKREIHFENITRNFIRFYKTNKNIKTVEITTAIEIDDVQKELFKKQVLNTYKANLEITTIVDKEIVGGFIVQIDDLLYDASVKRQLRNIQNTLLKEKL